MVKKCRLGGRGNNVLGAFLLLLLAPLVVINGAFAFKTSLLAAPVKKKGLPKQLLLLTRFRPHQQQQHGVTSSPSTSSSSSSSFTTTPSRSCHSPHLLAVRGGASATIPLHAIPAAAAAAAAGVVVIPSLKTIALSCLLPTSLGYIKSEYGVSYGYGTSIAILAFIILQQQLVGGAIMTATTWTWPALHAAALLFYGIRLDMFLLYRELCVPKFRKFRETIEEKAPPNRLARTPFILSCALLYACMASPLFVTATVKSSVASSCMAVKISIGVTWAGFLLAALGDLTKSLGKARRGQDALITGGVFRFFRHPNYTGEAIAWTASCVAAFAAAYADVVAGNNWKVHLYSLIASTVGLAGILLVLSMATKGLAKKQKEKYGDSDEYKQWIKRSWVGISL